MLILLVICSLGINVGLSKDPVSYRLHYFNGRGKGELIRYIFKWNNQKFDDVRFDTETNPWPIFKPKTPFGQAPVLEIDGELYAQSLSIARFLATRFRLNGKTDLEALTTDSIVDCIYLDMFVPLRKLKTETLDENEKEEIKEKLVIFFDKLELQVKGEGHFLASGVTWADIAFYNFYVDMFLKMYETKEPFLANYPALQSVVKTIGENAYIKQWVEERPETVF